MKIRMFTLLLSAATVFSSFAGCAAFDAVSGNTSPEEPTERTVSFAEPTYTTFSVEEMELKLPDSFQKQDMDDQIVFYNENYAVFLVREPFTAHESLQYMSLGEYGRIVLEASEIDATIKVEDGLYYFEYEAFSTDHTTKHNYFSVLFKSNEAFWIVQFVAPFWNASPMRSKFISWAKMIEFTD